MMKYNIFGSADSLDYDIMVKVDKLPNNKQQCHDLGLSLMKQIDLKDKPIQLNLCEAPAGKITRVYKGTPDECNNCLIKTYNLHRQYHDRIPEIAYRERDVYLKVSRCVRILLTCL